MKINLGAGDTAIPGFEPRDGKCGHVLYPLPDPDASCDEIRASHVLEHFPHGVVLNVIKDWVRALKPGGVLKIAVPDLKVIAERYLAGEPINVQGFLMGGQIDERDFHRCAFDRELLAEALRAAGLVGLRDWKSEIADCAALPISLNLAGTKPWPRQRIEAVISLPRLGFNDFWGCALAHLQPRGIGLQRAIGVYWEKKLTQAIETILADSAVQWVLTLDYDTIFDGRILDALIDVALRHPECDAVAPLQASRHHDHPLLFIRGADGQPVANVDRGALDVELLPVTSAHFGCTLIRAEKLRQLPRPWFQSVPDSDGRWTDESIDADIWFWQQWARAGNALHIATRVPVGHGVFSVRWPDINLEATHQAPRDFTEGGPPENVWR